MIRFDSDSGIAATQLNLLEDAIRIGELRAEISALEAMLDDPRSAWSLRQSAFQTALIDARNRYESEQATILAEAERHKAALLASRPLLQNVWESFLDQANADERSVMRQRDSIFGVGWWLDIPSPFFLDLSRDPVKALVSSTFRAIRLSRFESSLRNKRSRLSQFRTLKKFPSESGILTFLEQSESKSMGLRHVLTRHDAEASVVFLLSTASAPPSNLGASHEPSNYR